MGQILSALDQLRQWRITTAPAADTAAARLQFGVAAFLGGHASGTWIGGNLTGSARICDFLVSGVRVFAVDSDGLLQVGGVAPSGTERAYFRRDSATLTSMIHLDNQTNFVAADTPVRYQVRAVLSAATKIAYWGLDRYFRAAGMMLLATDAADGIGFAPNNYNLRARLTQGGDFYIAGGVGVGNSVVAAGLGALSRVTAFYDASGTLLGYVPVYASYS